MQLRAGILLVALTACAGPIETTDDTDTDTVDTDTSRVDTILALDGDVEAGQALYTDNCALCHMADGKGNGTAKDFTAGLPEDREAVFAILYGVDDTLMVGFDGTFSDQEVADAWAYVKDAFGP
jgi:mono/diheme cytochrome c family protein